MRTLGVDLAAATKNTAAAVIKWANGAARLAHLSLDVDDEAIVELFGSSFVTGIDWAAGQSSDGQTPSCRSSPAT